MSRSQKLRYMPQERYDPDQHVESLKEVLTALPDQGHLTMLNRYAFNNHYLLYALIAEFLPLRHEEILALLKGFIAYEQGDDDVISEDVEDEVAKLTDLLLIRIKGLTVAGKYDEAVGVAFGIVLAIEPRYGNVYDEGITFQAILEEVFDELIVLVAAVARNDDKELNAKLHQQISEYYEVVKKGDQFYEDRWDEVLESLLLSTRV